MPSLMKIWLTISSFSIYNILYQSCLCIISQYCSEGYWFDKFDSTFKLHLRAARAFLGLPKNSTNSGVLSEVDLLLPQFRTYICMIRQYYRMLNLQNHRLTKQVLLWDISLNETLVHDTVQKLHSEFSTIECYSALLVR